MDLKEKKDSYVMKGDVFIKHGIDNLLILKKVNNIQNLGVELYHVKYDKNINNDFQYKIIRGLKYDGTLLFEINKLFDMFLELLLYKTIYKEYENIDLSTVADIIYYIGDVSIDSTFPVYVEGKSYPLMESIYSIPVKCQIIYK